MDAFKKAVGVINGLWSWVAVVAIAVLSVLVVVVPYWAVKGILISILVAVAASSIKLNGNDKSTINRFRGFTRRRYGVLLIVVVSAFTYVYGSQDEIANGYLMRSGQYLEAAKIHAHVLTRFANDSVEVKRTPQIGQVIESRKDLSSKEQVMSKSYVPLHLVPYASCLNRMSLKISSYDDAVMQFSNGKLHGHNVTLAYKEVVPYRDQGSGLSDGKCDLSMRYWMRFDMNEILKLVWGDSKEENASLEDTLPTDSEKSGSSGTSTGVTGHVENVASNSVAKAPVLERYQELHAEKSFADWGESDMVQAVEILIDQQDEADGKAFQEEAAATLSEQCSSGSCAIQKMEFQAASLILSGRAKNAVEALKMLK